MAIGTKIIETLCPSCNFACHAPVLYIGKPITCPKCHHTFETVKFNYSSLLKHFIRIAIGNFLITEQKLSEIVFEQKAAKKIGRIVALEDFLIEKGLITIDQKNRLMASSLRKLNRMFISLAIEKNLISLEKGAMALDRQATDFQENRLTLVCDILTKSGLLTPLQENSIISEIEAGDLNKETGKVAVLNDRTGKYPLLLKVALEKDMITLSDIETAILMKKEKESSGDHRALEELLYESGMLSNEEKNKLILKTLKRIDKELGKIAIDNGFVTKDELVRAAGKQAALFKKLQYRPLFHILMIDDEITKKELDHIWSRFHEMERQQADSLAEKGMDILSHIAESRDVVRTPSSIRNVNTHTSIPDKEGKKEAVDIETEAMKTRPSYDPEIVLTVSDDSLCAYISLSPSVGSEVLESVPSFMNDIKNLLMDKGVVYGIVSDDRMEAYLRSSIVKNQPFKVACGDPPKEGRPAEIIHYFQTDYLGAGAVSDDGMIDFRDRGDIPFVKKGDVLAWLIPAVQGKNGYDIYGNTVQAQKIEEVHLQCGTGVVLSQDGLKIVASADGRPERLINGQISVLTELTIPGDVNYETGHIDFNGNIHIQGTICEGFKVRGVNLKAKHINGGEVEVTGSVDVSGGVVDSVIIADGYVQALYINKATIKSFGDLMIIREIIDSNVTLSGMVKSERCKIISSTISARMGVEVSQIGTEVSAPCKIRVGVDDHMNDMIRFKQNQMEIIKERVEKTQKKMEKIREDLGNFHQKIMEESVYQESLDADIERLNQKIEKSRASGHLKKIKPAENEINEIRKNLKKSAKTIQTLFNRQENVLEDILKGISSVEQGIHTIESLSSLIRSIQKKRDETEGVAKAAVKKQIFANTRVMGKHASFTVKEDLKNVIIHEIRVPDPEGQATPRWEMEAIRPT